MCLTPLVEFSAVELLGFVVLGLVFNRILMGVQASLMPKIMWDFIFQ